MNPFVFLSAPKKKVTQITPRSVAKERLELLLTAEHMQSSPELMEQMKKEIQEVVRKYMNTDHVQLKIQIDLLSEREQGTKNVKTIQIKRL